MLHQHDTIQATTAYKRAMGVHRTIFLGIQLPASTTQLFFFEELQSNA